MTRILIVEDNKEKLKNISILLNQDCNVPDKDISVAGNVQEARELLTSGFYDLLLLDLVLPVNEGDEPREDSGAKFLEEIYYNPNINIPVHIIGLTQFEKVFISLAQEFEDKVWGLINFNLSTSDWREKLKSKIFYLQNFKKKYKEFIDEENRFDVAIITALDGEFQAIKSTFGFSKFSSPNDTLIYYSGVVNTNANNNVKVITCCVNQMGMQSAAAVASKVISKFSPKLVIVAGICAGLKEASLSLGDIVVANQCWNYESGKISEGQSDEEFIFKPDLQLLTTNQSEISKIRDFSNQNSSVSKMYHEFNGNKPEKVPAIHFGSIGSGPYVLASKKYLQKLIKTDRKLIAIDMEGYGIYKACEFYTDTHAVFIKSVSDFGDAEKTDNYHDYAMNASARFVFDYITQTL